MYNKRGEVEVSAIPVICIINVCGLSIITVFHVPVSLMESVRIFVNLCARLLSAQNGGYFY